MKRKASPSPKPGAYFSDSENGDDSDHSGRRISASTPSSLTPDKTRFTKPPRATPDHRRGLRSPNPSPLSPRSRVPTDKGLSPLLTLDALEDYEQGELRGPDVGDRWAPQDTEDGGAFRSANGNPYPDSSRRESREEFVSHRQKRYKEAPPAGRDDGRWSDRDVQDRPSAKMPRSQVVGVDAERETHGRNGEPVHRNRRWEGDADGGQHHRNGERRGGRRHDGRDGREYVTGSRGRNGEHPRGFTRDGGRGRVDREAENGDVKHKQQRQEASEFPASPTEKVEPPEEIKVERQRPVLPLGKSGGVYIPPFKLAQMMKDLDDKSSPEYQRLTWDALRKSINGLVNKVNASNLKNILPELFSENMIRGRGLFARSCMKSQMASPGFTHVFAALVAVVNTKFPELGELLLKRIVLQLRRAFKRKDKRVLLAAAKFIAHLVNQQVAHEIIALELLTVLLEKPTDDSVEVAVGFVKECGSVLQSQSSQALHSIFERFRGILHEGDIDKRVQFMIEGLFAIRKAKFQGYAGVLPELDLVEEQDQITHEVELNEEIHDESYLDVFKVDPNFAENEQKYEIIKKEILGDESEEEGMEDGDGASDEDDSDEEEEEDEDEMEERLQIQDETETNLVNLRRTIYLTIMSSVDFEEAGHKLLKIKLEPGQEMELCVMLLECCSQERTYLRYYGLLGQRFCLINRVYQENFDQCFVKQYSMIHRLETNKLRNVAKFFAHLLGTDALPWQALGYIRLTEEDTTSSSRIFIKILFQELSEHLGLRRLNERLSDPMMQDSFDGIFPKDNPKNTRFAINFFTSIGLGGLTDSLREYLKNMPRLIMQHPPVLSDKDESGTSSSDTGSGSDSSDSDPSEADSSDSDDSSDDSDTSEDERNRRKKKSRGKK